MWNLYNGDIKNIYYPSIDYPGSPLPQGTADFFSGLRAGWEVLGGRERGGPKSDGYLGISSEIILQLV